MKKTIFLYMIIIAAGLTTCICFMNKNMFYFDSFETKGADERYYNEHLPLLENAGVGEEHAVIKADEDIPGSFPVEGTWAALMVDNDTKEAVVSYNAHRRIFPASTTKLVTALVVCDAISDGRISLDDKVTLDHNITFNVDGAVASPLTTGCTITVRNLMYGLLIRSYNDFAVILAEYIAGDTVLFADMMNEKASQLGATNSHFVNPHGLHEDDHYITAYDMYLIVNEAEKYDLLRDIDTYDSFSYNYIDAAGNIQSDDVSATNLFLSGSYELPSNIRLKLWKTGTTRLAGNVLTMITEVDGREYTMFIADYNSSEELYEKFTVMFNLTSSN